MTDTAGQWVDVCRIERLSPNRGVCALVGGEQVAIFRIGGDGSVLAISNYDPFSRAFVLSRGIVGNKGEALKVASPVYKHTFDLRTGQCFEHPDVRVPTYGARLVGGMVQIHAPVGGALRRPVAGLAAHATSEGRAGPLVGFRIAICESRERERLAEMLEAKGAAVTSCPLVTTCEAADPRAVEDWVRHLAAGQMQACIFFTGEGVSRIVATAERLGIRSELLCTLGKIETVTRGPKPARSLRDVGILPTHAVDVPTSSGVLDLIRGRNVASACVGVQLYPRANSRRFVQHLKAACSSVRPVWPYTYANTSDESAVRQLVTQMASGHYDLIVFTSRAQVDALFDLARRLNLRAALEAGLRRTRIAAIGPVAASALRTRGLRASIVPPELFFMKSLVKEIIAAWTTTSAGRPEGKRLLTRPSAA